MKKLSTQNAVADAMSYVICDELNIPSSKVHAVLQLLDAGNTIPFIARYRKEVTGSLDEVQISQIKERSEYLGELEKRKETILKTINGKEKLTSELEQKIRECKTKTILEDLYLPYKPKRRTKAVIAIEKGLENLAKIIMQQPLEGSPAIEAQNFVNLEKKVNDEKEALSGARDIVAGWISENAEVRAFVRQQFFENGVIQSKKIKSGEDTEFKYKDYYDYSERTATIPSHRYLALKRGEANGILSVNIKTDEDFILSEILNNTGYIEASPFSSDFMTAAQDALKRLVFPSAENEVRVELKMSSDRKAVNVFAENLKNLLMAPPAGNKAVLGVDPGIRTGCKIAAVDKTGKYLQDSVINIARGDKEKKRAEKTVADFVQSYKPFAIAVGNGTYGRETEQFIKDNFKSVLVVSVNEDGASVYSASEIAREEFPDLDLTVRGAISIARRLQDPLSELTKIDPKSIGVGQYQHDVYQPLLRKKLDETVENCVNKVGVDLNTASYPLLSRVAGIGTSLAKNIVKYRESNGLFFDRKEILKVPKLGPAAFKQSAGFLRILSGKNPLDSSAVHPERYKVVKKMASDLGVDIKKLTGDDTLVNKINIAQYVEGDLGEPTLKDILNELKKPGRDPRQSFTYVSFRDDVRNMEDLKEGMKLSGVVTNVTAFGAFVDVGVHRDGLVHISQLADKFVKDPSDIVKTGDILDVRVLEVDIEKKRIYLSAKTETEIFNANDRTSNRNFVSGTKRNKKPQPEKDKFSYNPFASLSKQK